jgi:allantoate deiminase
MPFSKDLVRAHAREVIRMCRELAACSEEPDATTRTFLSPPMRDVHARLTAWMDRVGMSVHVDHAGNLRGVYAASSQRPRLLIGSHLDTVPHAGAFDGILGVVLGVALVGLLERVPWPYPIEVLGFSEEEGVRFGVPFIGSRALLGQVDADLLDRRDARGASVRDAMVAFGLNPARLADARTDGALGYLEFHIEQGPVLDSLGLPLGVVTAIVGQTRAAVTFTGSANHAGTTPMTARRDALAAAAEWIGLVETEALRVPGLVATCGRLDVSPGATNVVPGRAVASLDVRHVEDASRRTAVDRLLAGARGVGERREIHVETTIHLDQGSVPMDAALTERVARAVERAGCAVHRMPSGAGHDAMILAPAMPAAMLFVRSPRGISHHPDENVDEADVAAALATGRELLEDLARHV